MLDLLGASLLFVIFFPVMILAAIIIKLSSKGSIIYKSKRLGFGGKSFIIYKFRTMFEGSDRVKEVTVKEDSRITVAGKFLRVSHLDELPQVINILKGDMSLVGPRPLCLEHYNLLVEINKDSKKRLKVKPGLTGLLQVKGRYWVISNIEKAVREEILYVSNYNFLGDIKILLQTIPIVIRGNGA